MTIFRKDIVDVQTTVLRTFQDNDNFANCLLLVQNNGFVTSSDRLYGIYRTAEAAKEDFKSNQKALEAIDVFFAQTDNPIGAGGYLAIGVFDSGAINIDAEIIGGVLNVPLVLNTINNISGQLIINAELNGTVITGTFIITPPEDTAFTKTLAALNAAPTSGPNAAAGSPYHGKISFEYKDGRFFAKIAGQTNQQSLVFSGDGAELLGLTKSTGSRLIQPVNIAAGDLGTVEKCLTYYSAFFDFHGVSTTDDIDSTTFLNATTDAWLKQNMAIMYTSTSVALETVNDPTSPTKFPNMKVCYCPTGLAQKNVLGAAMMSYMHGVNLQRSGAATTMHLKTLAGVDPVPLTSKQSAMLGHVDIDFYDVVKDTPVYYDSVGDDFVDNVYNTTYISFEVQKNLADLILSTKKVPQTLTGIHQIYANIGNTLHLFLNAGVLGKGLEWKGTISFGLPTAFRNSIKNHGYYIYIEDIDLQSEGDRQKRVCPPIYIAVKFAGAIHLANIGIIIEY